MMKHRRNTGRNGAWTRLLALGSAAVLTLTLIPVAAADEAVIGDGVTPTCDEAYYATLDYYGNLTDASIVKSYSMNGVSSLTDYGAYDSVSNLTNDVEPVTSDGKTSFDFGNDVPDHFYFEGKTATPFENLPWTVSLSYQLNGVPTKAEDLAGQSGMVEIDLDMIPNKDAAEYARNNYTLETMAVFNQNDILSLKADGAQVQLVGNLRLVLFVAMPGEEQHVSIQVGTDDFSFGGMTYLMVPATLSQLDQIADLKDKKADLESDYDKLSSSMDTLLDSMNNMSGSLRETASGLDELNDARGTISAGKGTVYGSADKVIGDLGALNENLSGIPGHLDTASEAVTAVTDDLTSLTKTTASLKTDLEKVRKALTAVQDDLENVRDALTKDDDNLQNRLKELGEDVDNLQSSIKALKTATSVDSITIDGMSLKEIKGAVDSMDAVYSGYSGKDKVLSESEFVNAALKASGQDPSTVSALISKGDTAVGTVMSAIGTTDQSTALVYLVGHPASFGLDTSTVLKYITVKQTESVMKTVFKAVAGSDSATMNQSQFYTAMLMMSDIQDNSKSVPNPADYMTEAAEGASSELDMQKYGAALASVQSANTAVTSSVIAKKDDYATKAALLPNIRDNYGIATASSSLLSDMGELCSILGSDGLSENLNKLLNMTSDTLTDLNALGTVVKSILTTSETVLDEAQKLDDTINQYVPDLKSALSDTKDTVSTLSTTISDTAGFLSSFESLMKTSGSKLDSGTKKTLTGLASSLRKAADSLETTGDVKDAKNNIDSIIRDVWGDYTGDVSNLLNMDSTASAVSLTSEQNSAPQSIQVLIRTQEIKVPKADESEESAAAASKTTFRGRIAAMFKGIWSSITGIFKH